MIILPQLVEVLFLQFEITLVYNETGASDRYVMHGLYLKIVLNIRLLFLSGICLTNN